MTAHRAYRVMALIAALAAPATAFAQGDATVGTRAEPPDDNELTGRLAVSHSLAVDDQTAQTVSFTDLRVVADAARLLGLPATVHVDGRGRNSWNDVTSDRLTISEAYVRYGEPTDRWRVAVGRQIVREIAAAEVDGLRVERRLGADTRASLFGGLLPHPLTGALSTELATTGASYDRRTRTTNHAGGAAVSWFDGSLDRAYLSQRSYLRLGRKLSVAGFAIVDAVSPRTGDAALDLTTLSATVRYVPEPRIDTALTVTHNHTILPSKWWQDWLAAKRREIGFTLDGDEPVGTRITSARWTTNLRVRRDLVPYTRLRVDRRHTESTGGYEARAGIKWSPRLGFADASYAYRDYFNTTSQLASALVGVNSPSWGGEAGALVLQSTPHGGAMSSMDSRTSYDLHAMAWLALGELLPIDQRLHLAIQYRALIDPEVTMHALFALLDYRL